MNTKKFDELRDAARRKAQELEDRFEIRRKVELGFNAATDAARKATDSRWRYGFGRTRAGRDNG